MKLEKLTPEQEARLPEIRDEWIQRATRTDWDVTAAKKAAARCYEQVNLPVPEIYICDSPLAGLKKIAELNGEDEVKWVPPHDGAGWCAWRARYATYYEFTDGEIAHELVPHFELDKSGAFWWWWFDTACVLTAPPKFMHFDRVFPEPLRYHCEDGPALRWPDGYEQYYWRGIEVPKSWIMEPETITKDTILGEENAERRRACTEIVGDRLLDILDARKVQVDDYGELYDIDDVVTNEGHMRYIRVCCPSSQRQYLIRVPPETKTAVEGCAWTGHLSEAEYKQHLAKET